MAQQATTLTDLGNATPIAQQATTLSDLGNAIPIAQRGDVISPESHNTLRDAVVAIITQLGGVSGTTLTTAPLVPAFLPVSANDPSWTMVPGVAKSPGSAAKGWMPVQLPDGALIQRLIVVAGRTGPLELPASMNIMLQRLLIRGGTAAVTLANISLVGSSFQQAVFDASANYAPLGIATADQPGAQVVDNDQYNYFVEADLLGAPANSNVSIFAVRVECQGG